MYIDIEPSDRCEPNIIRIPKALRESLGVDIGDILAFETSKQIITLIVEQAELLDIEIYGHTKAVVAINCPVLEIVKKITITPHQVTIGCDPEFFLINTKNNTVLNAEHFFNTQYQIGADYPLGELRPNYTTDPLDLTDNIAKLLAQVDNTLSKYPTVSAIAGSFLDGICSGFHVHLGMPVEILSFAAKDAHKFLLNVVYTLDYLVGIPTSMLDPDKSRRYSVRYGCPSNYRLSMRTLEYRTPGGYHLSSPVLTRNLLCLSFKVVSDIIQKAEVMSEGWTTMSKITDYNTFKHLYGLPNHEDLKDLFYSPADVLEKEREKIIEKLGTMNTKYDKYLMLSPQQQETKPLLANWRSDEKTLRFFIHQKTKAKAPI